MKKSLLLLGSMICFIGAFLLFATSYLSNGNSTVTITTDKAIVLSLDDGLSTESLVLESDSATYYLITAKIDKSATVTADEINGVLSFVFSDESEDLTLDLLTIELYEVEEAEGEEVKTADGESVTLSESVCAANKDNKITVNGISETKRYCLKICLKEKAEGYTLAELKQVGGSFSVSFKNGGDAE